MKSRPLMIFLIVVIVSLFLFSTVAIAGITKGPWLLNLSKRGVTVKWEASENVGEVHWGETESLGQVTPTTYDRGIHEATLECLRPDTQYFYQVVAGSTTGDLEYFYTGPEPDEPFMYVAFGDTRSNKADHQAVVDAIIAEAPAFVLHNGDLVDIAILPGEWNDFWDVETGMTKNIPFFPVMGNHEMWGGQIFFRKYFESPLGRGNETSYYGFQYGNSFFLNIDVTLPYGALSAQGQWIHEVLALAKVAPSIKHCFVQAHFPPYSASNHGEDIDVQLFRSIMTPVFESYGIDLMFSGHDHNYQHSHVNGIDYLVVGGGGAGLYGISPESWTVASERVLHYSTIEVDGTLVTVTAKRLDGTVIETFQLDQDFGDGSGEDFPEACADFDFDQDGLTDGEEYAHTYGDCTDPYNEDSDGDTYSDGDEVAAGTDPCDDTSYPTSDDDDDDNDDDDDDDDDDDNDTADDDDDTAIDDDDDDDDTGGNSGDDDDDDDGCGC